MTRLRLGLNHLGEHSFQDRLKPLCSCGNDIETSSHFLRRCLTYSNERRTLLNRIENVNYGILELSDTIRTKNSPFW